MFKPDPKVYSSMFSLPAEIADKCLKFANGEQLKVILCIFRNPSINTQELAEKVNLSISQTEECIEYWENAGILLSDSKKIIETENLNETSKISETKILLPEIRFINPTQQEIEQTLKNNGSMKRLFNEAQEILGKTLGYTMQCAVYSVVNFYGIKPDVANCLLHFAKSMGKTSQSDIQRIAKYWAENSVTDMASADEYIADAEKAKDLYIRLAEQTDNDVSGMSLPQLDMIREWLRWGFTFDEIFKSFEIMKSEKETGRLDWQNFRHMNGTLKNWRKTGMFTLEDIEKGTKKFGGKKENVKKETSFDAELAEKTAVENPKDFGSMKNRKRRKREA